MARLVLHIGTKKTGTTFLQRYLKANADALAREGWQYPDFLGHVNHRALVLPFATIVSEQHLAGGMPDPASRARNAQMWAQRMSEHIRPDQSWIISSEHFSGQLRTDGEVQDAVDFLRRFFDEITAVVFFRRQDFAFPSHYSQTVKAGGAMAWDWAYCQERAFEFDYAAMYRRWADALGDEQIHALPYLESYKRDAWGYMRQFGAAAGIDFAPDWVLPTEDKVNRSLSAEGIAFLQAVNRFIPRVNPDNTTNIAQRDKVVDRVMELTAGPSFRPDRQTIEAINEYYRTGNRELIEHLVEIDTWADQQADWESWLQQDPPKTVPSVESAITGARVAELIVALSEPKGPVAWGRPNGKPIPLRRLAVERLEGRRYGKALRRVVPSSLQPQAHEEPR